MSVKREREESPSPAEDIFRSETIEHGRSKFIGAFSAKLSVQALQRLPEFKEAEHRIAAWRKRSRQRTLVPNQNILYDLGFDDDGERNAGARLQNILTDMDAEGVLVVARWWRGENIGTIRWTHIENVAKEAVWKYQTAARQAQKEREAKRLKQEEEHARAKLINDLQERDYNIFTMRNMLATKTAKLHDTDVVPPTPQKPMDYTKMSMEVLEKQDKARDLTIAFVLGELNKVEAEQRLIEELESTQNDWEDAKEQQEETETNGPGPSTPKQ
ncbi:hypothetical protein BDV96DRAFT_498166 [Lophiotrema nucula]|uniref:Impact N-terminal domain-containing protein n=1 Tax=Lophiotrema nucula TaxID=690887 RepID=A0A6A5YZ36_9PLEO|nr:hypothetical protein BDV96DRAFT_498166 [Lophiotrema nucula]